MIYNESEILKELIAKYGNKIVHFIPFPKSYPDIIESPKAILLGCDPTNTSKNYRFEYVFGLGKSIDLERVEAL